MTELLIRNIFKMWLIGKTNVSRKAKKERERKEDRARYEMEGGTPLSIGTQVLADVILFFGNIRLSA